MQLVSLDSNDPNVISLFAEIDRLMNSLYPIASDQSLPLNELNQPNVHAIGLLTDQGIIACGAIVKKFESTLYGEIKRVYVKPTHRGKGLSRRIMQNLMYWAGQAHIPLLRLHLYESLGFTRCECFGRYRDNPLSVFMELPLSTD